jgi:hypothetical protein
MSNLVVKYNQAVSKEGSLFPPIHEEQRVSRLVRGCHSPCCGGQFAPQNNIVLFRWIGHCKGMPHTGPRRATRSMTFDIPLHLVELLQKRVDLTGETYADVVTAALGMSASHGYPRLFASRVGARKAFDFVPYKHPGTIQLLHYGNLPDSELRLVQ